MTLRPIICRHCHKSNENRENSKVCLMDIPQIHQCAHTMGAAREAKERDNAGNRTDIRKDISPEKKKQQ